MGSKAATRGKIDFLERISAVSAIANTQNLKYPFIKPDFETSS
jgi:hypothetical protein